MYKYWSIHWNSWYTCTVLLYRRNKNMESMNKEKLKKQVSLMLQLIEDLQFFARMLKWNEKPCDYMCTDISRVCSSMLGYAYVCMSHKLQAKLWMNEKHDKCVLSSTCVCSFRVCFSSWVLPSPIRIFLCRSRPLFVFYFRSRRIQINIKWNASTFILFFFMCVRTQNMRFFYFNFSLQLHFYSLRT